MSIDVMEYTYEYSKKFDDEIIKLDPETYLVLNTAEKEELAALTEEMDTKANDHIIKLIEVLPEDLLEFITDMIYDMLFGGYEYDEAAY